MSGVSAECMHHQLCAAIKQASSDHPLGEQRRQTVIKKWQEFGCEAGLKQFASEYQSEIMRGHTARDCPSSFVSVTIEVAIKQLKQLLQLPITAEEVIRRVFTVCLGDNVADLITMLWAEGIDMTLGYLYTLAGDDGLMNGDAMTTQEVDQLLIDEGLLLPELVAG